MGATPRKAPGGNEGDLGHSAGSVASAPCGSTFAGRFQGAENRCVSADAAVLLSQTQSFTSAVGTACHKVWSS